MSIVLLPALLIRLSRQWEPCMPYAINDDLPASIRNHLPQHAQSIYREAFNHALQTYGAEDTAFRIAWAAVKKRYQKVGDTWMRIE